MQSGRKGVMSGLSRHFSSVQWYSVARRYTIQKWEEEKKIYQLGGADVETRNRFSSGF